MKIMLKIMGTILISISPLFSALLTEDLQVVIPIGDPLVQNTSASSFQEDYDNTVITLRFIETQQGVFLVREHTRKGIVRLSQPTRAHKKSNSIIIFNTSSDESHEGESVEVNVILE